MRTSWITRECAQRNVANNRRCHVRTLASRGVRCRLRPRMCGTHTDCPFPNTLRIVQHQMKLGAFRTPVDSAKTAARFARSINVWCCRCDKFLGEFRKQVIICNSVSSMRSKGRARCPHTCLCIIPKASLFL